MLSKANLSSLVPIVANQARNEDPNVALRDAFLAARRQVEDYARRQRGDARVPVGRMPVAEPPEAAGSAQA